MLRLIIARQIELWWQVEALDLPPSLPHDDGGAPLRALSKNTINKPAGTERFAKEAAKTVFKVAGAAFQTECKPYLWTAKLPPLQHRARC